MNRKKANKMISILMNNKINSPEELLKVLNKNAQIKEIKEEVKEVMNELKEEKEIKVEATKVVVPTLEELKKDSTVVFPDIVGNIMKEFDGYRKNKKFKKFYGVLTMLDQPELPEIEKSKRNVADALEGYLTKVFMKKERGLKSLRIDLSTKVDLRPSLNVKTEDGKEYKVTNVFEVVKNSKSIGGVVNYKGTLYSVTPQVVFRAPWILKPINSVKEYIMAAI